MTQRRLRPSQGGQMREVRPSAELVAAMRAHDEKHGRCDGCGVGEAMRHLDGCPRVTAMIDQMRESVARMQAAPAEPRRWSVEAVRWMAAYCSDVGPSGEWYEILQEDQCRLAEVIRGMQVGNVEAWCRAELAKLPRWSEREIAYLRAKIMSDRDGAARFDALTDAEKNRMFAASDLDEAARLLAIHDVLSVVG